MRALFITLASAMLGAMLISCGGGGGSGTSTAAPSSSTSTPTGGSATGSNVLPVTVDMPSYASVNSLFATITLCAPDGSTCQTIDHVLIDTGSVGVRVFASALTPALAQALQMQSAAGGSTMAECMQFADGYTWGPLRQAALHVAGETVNAFTVQVAGDPNFPAAPTDCTTTGPSINTIDTFGANGVLGISLFQQDCGAACSQSGSLGVYYACAASCQPVSVPLAQQVQNPVSLFSTDNNGTAIVLPPVAVAGAEKINGSVIFGLGTQANNAMTTTTTIPVDPVTGYFTTSYKNRNMPRSFIDSGSNGLFFADLSLPVCGDNFYCPGMTQNLSAANQAGNGATKVVNFLVANADTLFASNLSAFDSLAGSNSDTGSFDWGLSFFYGRTVVTAIEGKSTTNGMGPYFSY